MTQLFDWRLQTQLFRYTRLRNSLINFALDYDSIIKPWNTRHGFDKTLFPFWVVLISQFYYVAASLFKSMLCPLEKVLQSSDPSKEPNRKFSWRLTRNRLTWDPDVTLAGDFPDVVGFKVILIKIGGGKLGLGSSGASTKTWKIEMNQLNICYRASWYFSV